MTLVLGAQSIPLYRIEPYLQETNARVIGYTPEGGIIADVSIFYPTGDGQPGDSGWLIWQGGRVPLATAVQTPEGTVALVPSAPSEMPPIGAEIRQVLDWRRRYRHMRVHTALHLLSAVLAVPVLGSQIGADRGRLDVAMSGPIEDLEPVALALNALIARDVPVSEVWMSLSDLAATDAVLKAPLPRLARGQNKLRMIRIGAENGAGQPIDLQPCLGTHVARTGEIGSVLLENIESKGRSSRRIRLALQN